MYTRCYDHDKLCLSTYYMGINHGNLLLGVHTNMFTHELDALIKRHCVRLPFDLAVVFTITIMKKLEA